MSSEANNEVLDIEHLPTELLEEILLYVPDHELLDLTIVSKTFNKVISSSGKLMDKVEVLWTERMESCDLIPLVQRKYRKLYFNGFYEFAPIHPRLIEFIANYATSLKKLTFDLCKLSLKELITVLSSVAGNLEELEFDCTSVEKDCWDINPINMPKLRKLNLLNGDTIESEWPVFALLIGSKVTHLIHDLGDQVDPNSQTKCDVYARFLLSLKHLTELGLSYAATLALFRNTDFLSAVLLSCEFKLSSAAFYVKKFDELIIDARDYENIFSFLTTQHSTLRKLVMDSWKINNEIMNQLLLLPLNCIQLLNSTFVQNVTAIMIQNSTIQQISFSNDFDEVVDEEFVCSILKNCTNLKHVDFDIFDVTVKISRVLAFEMNSLRELALNKCKFNPVVTYPAMTTLTFKDRNTSDRNSLIQMILFNPQLRKISVPEQYRNNEEFQAAIRNMSLEEIRYKED